MNIEEYINNQFIEHNNYVNRFKKANSICNEYYHPKTSKTISYNNMINLIEKDRKKRTKFILNKLELKKTNNILYL